MDPEFETHRSELVARERSGHTAVVEDNLLYVWGGYVVRQTHKQTDIKEPVCAQGCFLISVNKKTNLNTPNPKPQIV